jgi:hypothetical protein
VEDIIDALRRIVSRWVETITPITENVYVGDTVLTVNSTLRFLAGDEVMIEGPLEGEPYLIIDEILDDTTLSLATPVANEWLVSGGPALRKLINGMFIEGIYVGDPEVIPQYPAITINGTTIESEWMTLDSVEEHFDVELNIYVEESTQEAGYRFLLKMIKAIREGLKRNLYPLINDYETTALKADVIRGDTIIKVQDPTIFKTGLTDETVPYPWLADSRVFIEDRWKSEESRVRYIYGTDTIQILPRACQNFRVVDDTILIRPQRFIFNSWPQSTDIGKASKGTLLQAASIRWFAKEEQPRNFLNNDPHLK